MKTGELAEVLDATGCVDEQLTQTVEFVHREACRSRKAFFQLVTAKKQAGNTPPGVHVKRVHADVSKRGGNYY